jgi:hypothetical protein
MLIYTDMNYSIRLMLRTVFSDKSRLPSVKSTLSISSDPKFIILAAEIENISQSYISSVLSPLSSLVFTQDMIFFPSSLINRFESNSIERMCKHFYFHSDGFVTATNPFWWSRRSFAFLFSRQKLVAGGLENQQPQEDAESGLIFYNRLQIRSHLKPA